MDTRLRVHPLAPLAPPAPLASLASLAPLAPLARAVVPGRDWLEDRGPHERGHEEIAQPFR